MMVQSGRHARRTASRASKESSRRTMLPYARSSQLLEVCSSGEHIEEWDLWAWFEGIY